MSKKKTNQLRASLDRGRSTGEREGVPGGYGGPDEAQRLSGDLDHYQDAHHLISPDRGRHAPIRGDAVLERVGSTQGAHVAAGQDVIMGPSHREVMGMWALQAAENLSEPQHQLGLIRRRRGPAAKQDYPDGTGRTEGKIKARVSLGPAVARAADLGHDPGAAPVSTDYLHQPAGPRPDVLAKYVDAARLLPQPTGFGSGFPRWHEMSNHQVMGTQLLHELESR